MRKILIVVVAVLATVVPARADSATPLGPPYRMGSELTRCGDGSFSTCAIDGSFDPKDGSIDVDMRVAADETPGAGRGFAFSVAWFTVKDRVPGPVERLTYEVDIRVDDAEAIVDGVYATTVGAPGRSFAFAEASFLASSEECGCSGSTGNIRFVSTRHPGTPSQRSSTTITLRATLEPQENAGPIPAGAPVEIAFLFHARAELGWSIVSSAPVPDTGEAAVSFAGRLLQIRRVSNG